MVADANRLPFRSATFDACWARAVLIHSPDAASVVREIARVLRPGGRTVLSEPDHGTHVVATDEQAVFEAVLAHRRTRFRDPIVGRELPHLATIAGLEITATWATPIVLRSYQQALAAGGPFGTAVDDAVADGAISNSDAERYDASLRKRDAEGSFLFTGVSVTMAAQRPA